MIILRWFITLAALLPIAARAEQPSWSELSRQLFVLRATGRHAAQQTGIARFDPRTSIFFPWIDVPYAPPVAGSGSPLGLSTLDDRVLLQGADYYEFDTATGRLLRRYAALDPLLKGWAFQGVTLDTANAATLDVQPGTYGFPICPRTDFGSRCVAPPEPFPGYAQQPGVPPTDPSILLFRHAQPFASTLQLAARLQTDGPPEYARRFLSIDTQRHGLWSWSEYTPTAGAGMFQRLSFIPIGPQRIDEEITKDLRQSWNSSSNERTFTHAFAYLPADDAYYVTLANVELETFSFLRIPAGALEPRAVIESGNLAAPWAQNDAITAMRDALPSVFLQLVPAIGEGPGARSTYWRTDVYLFNPSPEVTTARLRRVSRPEQTRTFTLPAYGGVKIPSALRLLGGGLVADGGDGIGTDALVVEAPYRWGKQLAVYSRTYTPANGGTYGQAVPAVPTTTGYSTHTADFTYPLDVESMVSTIILDKRNPGQYRHNIGVVNDGDTMLTVRLRFDRASTLPPQGPDDERSFTVAPHTVANVGIESLFPPSIFRERAPRLWIAAQQPAAIWLSIVDNTTGDATFVPFSLFTMRGGTQTVALPAAASTPGANGTRWRTDLYGLFLPANAGENPQSPLASFYPAAGTRCGEARSVRLQGVVGADGVPETLLPYYRSIFPDIAAQAGCDGQSTLGAFEFRVSSWMSAFARTYTTTPDGGTLGEMLPLYPSGGWPEQHFAGIEQRSEFRVNVGLYNGLEYDVQNRILLYTARGERIGDTVLPLASHALMQLPLATLFGTLPDGLYSISVVPTGKNGEPGRSWAYISIVDNVTGDPTNWW